MVTIKVSPAGNLIWSRMYNGVGNGSDAATGIAVDAAGNIFVAGNSIGAGNTNDLVLIKYNTNGVQQFVKTYDNGGYDEAIGVGIDAMGNIYLGGTSFDNVSQNDMIVIKYNSSGNQQWINRYNNSNNSEGAVVFKVLPNGNSFIAGNSYTTTSQQDVVVASYNTSGNQLWTDTYNYKSE